MQLEAKQAQSVRVLKSLESSKRKKIFYLIVHVHPELVLGFFDGRRHRRDPQLDALLVVGLGLHVLRQVALRLEGEVAMAAGVRPEVGVRPDVLLQHGRLLATDAAAVADVAAPPAAADVRVVVVEALVAAFDGRRRRRRQRTSRRRS